MTLFCIEETLLGSGFQLRLSRLVFRLKGKPSSKPTPSRCRTLHNASFVSRIKKLVNFQTPESRYLVVSWTRSRVIGLLITSTHRTELSSRNAFINLTFYYFFLFSLFLSLSFV